MADILTKIKEWHKESEDGNREWRTRGIESYDFYKGKQWASDDVSKLDSEGRPHLTLNQIFPIINLVSGFERGNKMQIQVYPKRGGMQPFAEILTSLAKHAQDTANIEYKQSITRDGTIINIYFKRLGNVKKIRDPQRLYSKWHVIVSNAETTNQHQEKKITIYCEATFNLIGPDPKYIRPHDTQIELDFGN